MVDIIEDKPQGLALDMMQSRPIERFETRIVGSNSYDSTAGSDVCVITAGLPRKPGMSRMDLLEVNAKIVDKDAGVTEYTGVVQVANANPTASLYNNRTQLLAAVEFACLDLIGQHLDVPVYDLLGGKLREMDKLQVRQLCYDYAEKWGGVQSEQFQRLGILGDWERPYYTMAPAYEACTLEVFARFVEAGLVYKQLKPVPWSVANQTALADAELEYQDVEDTSVYVEFPLTTPLGLPATIR